MDHISHQSISTVPTPNQAQVWSNQAQTVVVAWESSVPLSEEVTHDWSERFQKIVVLQALDLHQVVQDFIQAAQQEQAVISVSAFAVADSRCVLIARQGGILLRRGEKIGPILVAEQELQVVEGSLRDDDTFILVPQLTAEVLPVFTEFLQSRRPGTRPLEDQLVRLERPLVCAVLQKAEAVSQATTPQVTASSVPNSSDGDRASSRRAFPQQLRQMIGRVGKVGPLLVGILRGTFGSVQAAVVPLFSKDVYVRRRHTKNVVKILLPLLIVIITASAFLFVQHTQRVEQERSAEAFLAPLLQRFTEVKTLAAEQPLEARRQTDELLVQIDEGAKQFESQSVAKSIVEKRRKEVQEFATSISGQQELARLDEFYNLRFIQSDLSASKMDMNDARTLSSPDQSQTEA